MNFGRTKAQTSKTTTITFSTHDLETLGRLVSAGQAMLGGHGPAHPAVTRLKAAMTRLGIPIPRGL
jgi:hypothetical protein